MALVAGRDSRRSQRNGSGGRAPVGEDVDLDVAQALAVTLVPLHLVVRELAVRGLAHRGDNTLPGLRVLRTKNMLISACG
jgi:hypothetical protein